MNVKTGYIRSLVSGTGALGFRLALNVLLIPVLIRLLGLEHYGFYLFLINFSEMLLLFDAGLTAGLVQKLSQYKAEMRPVQLNQQLSGAIVLYALLSCVLLLCGMVGSSPIANTIPIPSAYQFQASLFLNLVFLEGAINLSGQYFFSILKANFQYEWTNLLDNFRGIINNVLSIILILAHHGFLEILISRVAVAILLLGIAIYRASTIERLPLPGRFSFSLAEVRSLASLSFFMLLQKCSLILSSRVDSILIAANLDMKAVAIYEVVFRIFGQLTQLCNKLHESLIPVFMHLKNRDGYQETQSFLLKVSSLLNYVIWLLIILIVANYAKIISFLASGKIEYTDTIPLMVLASLTVWNTTIQWPATNYLVAHGQHKSQAMLALAFSFLKLLISLILVRSLGLTGIALGTLIPYLIQYQLMVIPTCCKQLNLSFAKYISFVYLRNLVPIAIVIVIMLLFRLLAGWYTPIPAVMFVGCIVASIVSGGVWFNLTLSTEEKNKMLAKLNIPIQMRKMFIIQDA